MRTIANVNRSGINLTRGNRIVGHASAAKIARLYGISLTEARKYSHAGQLAIARDCIRNR